MVLYPLLIKSFWSDKLQYSKQIEINIDYILMLVKKYHDTHCEDKEVLITIRKAVDASPELRSKKALIEAFIAGVNDVDDVVAGWNSFVAQKREEDLETLIREEKLKEPDTRAFLEQAFLDGEVKTSGTDIDKLMPPVSRFGGSGRATKKQTVIEKLRAFFEKYFGVGTSFTAEEESAEPEHAAQLYDQSEETDLPMAAEEESDYKKD